MTKTYIAKYGDWLAKIAEQHGSTVSEIWNHPENAGHRAKRGSPDVLYPGDVLRIPVVAPPPSPAVAPPLLKKPTPDPNAPPASDLPWAYPPYEGPFSTKPTWECPGGTCECHPVPADGPKDEHVIVFYDPLRNRMPYARCCVYEQGRRLTPDPTKADGAGELRIEIGAGTSSLRVEWAPANMPPDESLPYRKIYNVKMGDDRDVAIDRRLANLGFSRGKRREDNVRDYQRAYMRPVTGNIEEIRFEVLDRHDHGRAEVLRPQQPAGQPPNPTPETRSSFGSPPARLPPDNSASTQTLAPGASQGVGGGPTTSTGQNMQGSAVPDAGRLSRGKDENRHRAWIIHYDSADFPLCEKEADKDKGTHYMESPETDASLSTLKDQLAEAVRGDIVTTVFHTSFARVNGAVQAIGVTNSTRKDAEICHLAEILEALNRGPSPAAVVMCGCDTAQFLPHIIRQTKVPVAFGLGVEDSALDEIGITANVVSIDCDAAADAITASLMRGDTLKRARELGTMSMRSGVNPMPIVAVLEVGSTPSGDAVDIDLSLRDNGLLPNFSSRV